MTYIILIIKCQLMWISLITACLSALDLAQNSGYICQYISIISFNNIATKYIYIDHHYLDLLFRTRTIVEKAEN